MRICELRGRAGVADFTELGKVNSTEWRWGLTDEGNYDFGTQPGDDGPRAMTLPVAVRGDNNGDLETNIRLVRLLLAEAADLAADGLRGVTFVLQPETAEVETVYDVLGGDFDVQPFTPLYLGPSLVLTAPMLLEVEPTARAEDTEALAGVTLAPLIGLTHRFLHHTGGTVFSDNMVALQDGSLWQSSLFTTSPGAQLPTVGDVLYFGNTHAKFSELLLRIRQAGSGITYGPIQYRNATVWTTLPLTRNDFKTAAEFDTAALGMIGWDAPADWATVAVNSVTAYWVRVEVTAVAAPVAPLLSDGPVSSLWGRAYLPPGTVRGDSPARMRLALLNPGATALAGVIAGIGAGRLSDVPPPACLPCVGADLFIPSSGDVTAARVTDATASVGERVTITFGAVDRAQKLLNAYLTATVPTPATDKIDLLGAGDFFIEVIFRMPTVGQNPRPFVSRWDSATTAPNDRVIWFGLNAGKLHARVFQDDGVERSVSATLSFSTGWTVAVLEFDASRQRLRLYQGSLSVGSASLTRSALRQGRTTALRVGQSVGWTPPSGSSLLEDSSRELQIGSIWIEGRSREAANYELPTAPRVATAFTKWLIQADEQGGGGTIADSSASPKNATRSTGTAGDNSVPGYFVGQVQLGGGRVRALGMRLPQSLGREHAGRSRLVLRAKPATALGIIDDIQFALQLSAGSNLLPMQSTGKLFPTKELPGDWYLIDFGTFSHPTAALGHVRETEAARSWMQVDLFVTHVALATAVHVDCLYVIPQDAWSGSYASFGATYDAASAVVQSEAFIFDDTGPEPRAAQADSAGVLRRNPFAVPVARRGRLRPDLAHWLVAIPLRGSTDGIDHLESSIADRLTATVVVQARHDGMAS